MPYVTFERFVEPTYQLTNVIDEVPQLGQTAKERLAENNIVSTLQLIAHYLERRTLPNANVEFTQWLKDMGAPATHAGRIAMAIGERVTRVGIQLTHIQLSDHIVQTSRMTVDKSRDIAGRTFNNSLEHDFEGCGFGSPGKPSESVAAFGSTDKLIAAFLKKFDGPPTAAMADAFYKELSTVEGFKAKSFKSTIIEAIKIRLSVGIDRVTPTYEPTLAAHAEDAAEDAAEDTAEEAPGTPERPKPAAAAATTPVTGGTQRARTRPAQNLSAPRGQPEAPRAFSTQGVNTPRSRQEGAKPSAKSGGVSPLLVLAMVGVVGAGAYMRFFAGAGDVEM